MIALPPGCAPCPASVRAIARAVRHHVAHPVRRIGHVIARHPGKVVMLACCAGTLGPIGGVTVPHGDFLRAPDGHAAAVGQRSDSLTWPEMPGWTIANGPVGYGTGSNSPSPIPVYKMPPAAQFLSTQPNLYAPARIHQTSVPEPSSFALLLLPFAGVALIRRRTRA